METPALQGGGPGTSECTPYDQDVVLLTTVDIAPGYSKVIKMRRGENAYNVAQLFCRAHGLPDVVISALEAHLQSHLDQVDVRLPSSEVRKSSGILLKQKYNMKLISYLNAGSVSVISDTGA